MRSPPIIFGLVDYLIEKGRRHIGLVGSHAIHAAKALGTRVPADISIIGYDDTYIPLDTHPALSTMHVDTLAMGRAAVHLLALQIEHPETACMSLIIHPPLVERESVTSS